MKKKKVITMPPARTFFMCVGCGKIGELLCVNCRELQNLVNKRCGKLRETLSMRFAIRG